MDRIRNQHSTIEIYVFTRKASPQIPQRNTWKTADAKNLFSKTCHNNGGDFNAEMHTHIYLPPAQKQKIDGASVQTRTFFIGPHIDAPLEDSAPRCLSSIIN